MFSEIVISYVLEINSYCENIIKKYIMYNSRQRNSINERADVKIQSVHTIYGVTVSIIPLSISFVIKFHKF